MNKDKLISLLDARIKYIENYYTSNDRKIALFEVETLKKIVMKSDEPVIQRVRKIPINKSETLFNIKK